ncbi:protein rep [Listeria monocytogenes]|jgi:hypothetical protein|nr:protein rep [Moraxella osloensis]EKD1048563.1 protein rep [Listeria monocytogenes]
MDNLSNAYYGVTPRAKNNYFFYRSEKKNNYLSSEISPLGIYTECQSNRSTSDFQNDKLIRISRYCLQDIARKLLPKERVSNCLRYRISKDSGVKVLFNPVREKAHYGNVIRCGSPWTCSVCSAQISEKRRLELKKGMERWRDMGGHVYLLTLTNPHYYGDNLKQLLEGQKKALAYLWGNRKPKEMLKALGKQGHIIATEVTYGENGWHPHYHILLFMRHEVTINSLKSFLAIEWQNCCKKAGLPIPSLKHGVDLRDGKYATEYVTKFGIDDYGDNFSYREKVHTLEGGWGLPDEMTKGHTKKGRNGSLTPFDLLRQSVESPEYGKLFQVFAIAFKGKRQLHWTRGLKALLAIDEKTDEELAEETEKEAFEVRELAFQIWQLICKYNMRAEFLECVESDISSGNNSADDLVMKLAKFEIDEILKTADMEFT